MTDNGIVNLCYELQASHHFELKVLDLSQNQITDVGAKTLVTFMQQFRNLKYLNLEDNLSISEGLKDKIAQILKNRQEED